jgi:AcrR family transcriptional regulator
MRSKGGVFDGDGNDKSVRILDSALALFVRYGIKRTSVDDVVREAQVAKGTFYLYYPSKEALFTAVAERFCGQTLMRCHEALGSAGTLSERVLRYLDARVGAPHRMVCESPHIAELKDARMAAAAEVCDEFDRRLDTLFSQAMQSEGIQSKAAGEMFLAAAVGTLELGASDEKAYHSRLKVLVDTLLAGLERLEKKSCGE